MTNSLHRCFGIKKSSITVTGNTVIDALHWILKRIDNNEDRQKNLNGILNTILPFNWKNENLSQKWSDLFKIKQEANIAIEEKRSSKEIGSSLEAQIKLTVNKNKFELLKNLDLAEYFITSKAEKILSEKDETKIEVTKAVGEKCERCWKILEKKCNRCSDLI